MASGPKQSLEHELGANGLEIAEVLGNVAGDAYDPESPEFAAVAVPGSP